jgi:hypothetical protein
MVILHVFVYYTCAQRLCLTECDGNAMELPKLSSSGNNSTQLNTNRNNHCRVTLVAAGNHFRVTV